MDQILSTTGGITPPQELVQQWQKAPEFSALSPCVMVTVTNTKLQDIATQAAQWGADQELEAIIELAEASSLPEKDRYFDGLTVAGLRAARRPKPPSLKEQALGLLNEGPVSELLDHEVDTIRRALEQLPDKE
jgi:hypothetical protein